MEIYYVLYLSITTKMFCYCASGEVKVTSRKIGLNLLSHQIFISVQSNKAFAAKNTQFAEKNGQHQPKIEQNSITSTMDSLIEFFTVFSS